MIVIDLHSSKVPSHHHKPVHGDGTCHDTDGRSYYHQDLDIDLLMHFQQGRICEVAAETHLVVLIRAMGGLPQSAPNERLTMNGDNREKGVITRKEE